MTDEDKDALIGKSVREHANAATEVATLRAALREMSIEFTGLAKQLSESPEKLFAVGQGPDEGRFAGGRYFARPDRVSISKVLEMVEQLREALTKEDNLEKHLTRLGVPPAALISS